VVIEILENELRLGPGELGLVLDLVMSALVIQRRLTSNWLILEKVGILGEN